MTNLIKQINEKNFVDAKKALEIKLSQRAIERLASKKVEMTKDFTRKD